MNTHLQDTRAYYKQLAEMRASVNSDYEYFKMKKPAKPVRSFMSAIYESLRSMLGLV